MRIQKIQTSDRGPPPPPTTTQPLAGPLYCVSLVVYYRFVVVLSNGSHFLLIVRNLDPILAAFIHSFLCDVDFFSNVVVRNCSLSSLL